MLFGYYDRTGYPNMYTGSTNGGVCPLTDLGQGEPTNPRYPISGSCYIISTENGLDGTSSNAHVDDYWISYGSAGPDPWEGNWPEHTWGLCTADFLGTNQWKWDYSSYPGTDGNIDSNGDGATTIWTYNDGSKLYDWYPGSAYGIPTTSCCHGMRLFAESRGYSVDANYNQLTDNQNSNGFTFVEFQSEIDAGRPVLVHVIGHTMVGIGYDTATNSIYIHDTWDNNVHSMTWGGSYAEMDMYAVTVIHLAPPDQYNLTISSTSGGSVTTPGEGTFTYDEGTVVDLVATPDEGYRFDNWTGDVGTIADVNAATTTITMNGDYSITANFVAVYDLTTSSTEGGSVTTPGEGTFYYDEGTVVDLVATPDEGYRFDEWTGDVGTIADVNAATTTITMNGDYSITANFVAIYDLTTSSTAGGSVTTPGEGTFVYDEGTVVDLVATPDAGYRFDEWTGDVGTIADVNAASTNITMNGDYSITANFVAIYDLTTSSTAGGSVTTPGEGTFTYDEGTVVDLVATPDAGYRFDEWTGDVGTIADVNAAATNITMNGDYSVTAEFIRQYDLTISSTEGGSVTTPGEGTYTYDDGTVVDLVATPDAGYRFDEWTGDVGTIADVNAASTNITMNGDYSITANFLDTAPPTGYGCASPEDEAECVPIDEALLCSTASDDSAPIEYKFAIASDVAFSQDPQESGWQQSTNWTPTTALSYGKAYWWRVKARDAKNNESAWSTPFTFVTIYKFDLALKSGWNMISLPLESCTGETDPGVILPDVEVIYTWNCETASYDSPSEIVPGKGYWALVFEDVTETIYGTPIEEYQLSSDCEGWHMVGSLYVDGQVNVGSGSVYGSLYHWNPETLSYIARPLDDVRPGEGYCLLAFTNFSISVVPKPPGP
jgi:hypothetical protein